MLTRDCKEKIIQGVLDRLPENIEFMKLWEEIENQVRQYSLDILTKEERDFLEKYPDLVVEQGDICCGYSDLPVELRENFPRLERNYSWYYTSNIEYRLSYRLELNINKRNSDKTVYPIIGDNWLDIYKDHPDFVKELLETKLIKAIVLNKKVIEKLKVLEEVINRKSIGLKDLKAYYVELYKICKQ